MNTTPSTVPFLACLLACAMSIPVSAEDSWDRFRGPNGSGHAVGDGELPAEIGPDSHVIWKTELLPGHSSPVIHGDRIWLTAADGSALLVIAIDRQSGRVVWKEKAPEREREEVHRIGSHAQSTPATDGKLVVSFFGSYGLVCHDRDGRLVWKKPLGPFKNNFGAGSSPVIEGDVLLLVQDHDTDSFLAAYDKKTGKRLWRADRSEFPRGYSTPIIWEVDGKRQVVVAGTLKAIGYDLENGEPLWNASGLSRIVVPTPVIGAGNRLILATWSPGADADDRIRAEPFDELLKSQDTNRNELLERDEVKQDALRRRFNQIDRNKDGKVTRAEYDYMKNIFESAQNVVMAIEPGGSGDITTTHVAWKRSRFTPYVPSPIHVGGHVFVVRNGGIVSCFDVATGERGKRGRVSSTDDYYSSPVYGDGKIYAVSQRGVISVISAVPQWEEIATSRLGEEVFATPAIVGGRIYLRTDGHLYCFGKK